jgi:hypothetical protein
MTRRRRRRLIKTRRTVTGLLPVASIAFLAGMTDVVGLMLTGNFVSFMTGNTTPAAIALGTGDFGHATVLFSAILTFIAGNALGIVIAHAADRRASHQCPWHLGTLAGFDGRARAAAINPFHPPSTAAPLQSAADDGGPDSAANEIATLQRTKIC